VPDIDHIRGEIERRRVQVLASAARSDSLNEPGYPRPQPMLCSKECLIKSVNFANSATALKQNFLRHEAKFWAVGNGERVISQMV